MHLLHLLHWQAGSLPPQAPLGRVGVILLSSHSKDGTASTQVGNKTPQWWEMRFCVPKVCVFPFLREYRMCLPFHVAVSMGYFVLSVKTVIPLG